MLIRVARGFLAVFAASLVLYMAYAMTGLSLVIALLTAIGCWTVTGWLEVRLEKWLSDELRASAWAEPEQ